MVFTDAFLNGLCTQRDLDVPQQTWKTGVVADDSETDTNSSEEEGEQHASETAMQAVTTPEDWHQGMWGSHNAVTMCQQFGADVSSTTLCHLPHGRSPSLSVGGGPVHAFCELLGRVQSKVFVKGAQGTGIKGRCIRWQVPQ